MDHDQECAYEGPHFLSNSSDDEEAQDISPSQGACMSQGDAEEDAEEDDVRATFTAHIKTKIEMWNDFETQCLNLIQMHKDCSMKK